jgi:hypothetical protein
VPTNLEQELFEIAKKLHSILEQGNISLQGAYNLYFKAKEKYLAAKKEQRTEEAGQFMLAVFFRAGKISEKFIAEWQSGQLEPTKQEIELLEKGCEEVLKAFDSHFKSELLALKAKPYEVHRAEVGEKISRVGALIRQCKAK